jgi:hypothetical protein
MFTLRRALASALLLLFMASGAAGQFPGEGFGPFPGGPGAFPGGPGMFPGGPGIGPGGPWQGPDWGGQRSMRRWGGDQGPPWARGNSPDARGGRSQQLETALRQLDANGDGSISPSEVGESRRAAYEAVVRRAGLDPAGPVSVQALRDAVSQRRSGRGGGPPGGMPPWGAGPWSQTLLGEAHRRPTNRPRKRRLTLSNPRPAWSPALVQPPLRPSCPDSALRRRRRP